MRLCYSSGSLEIEYLTETFLYRYIETALKVNFAKEERGYNAVHATHVFDLDTISLYALHWIRCHGSDNRVTRKSSPDAGDA